MIPSGSSSRQTAVGLLLALCVAGGCTDMRELMTLQLELAREFRTPATRINLSTDGDLTVRMQDSPLETDERQRACREVAEFVRDNYSRYATLRTVSVVFASESGFGPVRVSRQDTPCEFRTADLGPAQPEVVGAADDGSRPDSATLLVPAPEP